MASTLYKIDSGAAQTYSGAVSIPDGQHTITYWSVDIGRQHRERDHDRDDQGGHGQAVDVDHDQPGLAGRNERLADLGDLVHPQRLGCDLRGGVHLLQDRQRSNPDVLGKRGLDPAGLAHRQLLVRRHRRQHRERDHDTGDQGRPGQAGDDADHLAREPGRNEQLVQAGRASPSPWPRPTRPPASRTRFYTVDGGAQQTYSGTVTVSSQGDHTVTYWSVDNAGNTENTNTTHIKLDNVKPTTTLTTSPASPDGTNNWFKQSSVTFTLAATDATSGAATTLYTVDGGAQQTYSGTVTVSGQGDHTVTYWSVDNAGNTENTNTTHIKLDNVKPTTTLTTSPASPDGTNSWFKQASVTFTLAATDATSGVANRFYTIDGGGQQTYSGTVTVSGQADHTVTYWSVDNAGNTENTNTTHIKLDNVAPDQLARADQQDRRLVREREHRLLPRGSRRLLLDPEHRRGRHLRRGLEQLPRARRNDDRLDAHHAGREDDALRRPLRLEPLQLERRHDQLADRRR